MSETEVLEEWASWCEERAKQATSRIDKDTHPNAALIMEQLSEWLLNKASELRKRYKPAPCVACRIEAEIGTEEAPHPVPERFHTCTPRPAQVAPKPKSPKSVLNDPR
jgi:hypothetical protein